MTQLLSPAHAPITFSLRSVPTSLLLIGADVIGLLFASVISVYVRLALNGQFVPELYWQLWPLLGVMVLIYGVARLYPGVGLSPVEELRRLCLSTTLFYMALGAVIFLTREGTTYSRGIFLMAWLLSMSCVWFSRIGIRHIFARCSWWGFPVLIMGAGKTGELVIRALKRQPGLGLKPIAVLDDDPRKHGTLEGVPVLGKLSLAPYTVRELGVRHAIVAMPGVPRAKLLSILEDHGRTFPHLIVIPDLFGLASLWVGACDIGGILGLEIQQRLLLPGPRLTKAALDWVLTLIVGILTLPLFILIIIAVKLDSPGPIFYGQYRLGQGARPFIAWKIRTMVTNADWVLEKHLAQNQILRKQWEQERKLKCDPRITRVGRFLRRTDRKSVV